MESGTSAHSYWPKASRSLLSQSAEERTGKAKDQSQETLDKIDGDMDVRGRKRKPLRDQRRSQTTRPGGGMER